jgi:hypothetical protein
MLGRCGQGWAPATRRRPQSALSRHSGSSNARRAPTTSTAGTNCVNNLTKVALKVKSSSSSCWSAQGSLKRAECAATRTSAGARFGIWDYRDRGGRRPVGGGSWPASRYASSCMATTRAVRQGVSSKVEQQTYNSFLPTAVHTCENARHARPKRRQPVAVSQGRPLGYSASSLGQKNPRLGTRCAAASMISTAVLIASAASAALATSVG